MTNWAFGLDGVSQKVLHALVQLQALRSHLLQQFFGHSDPALQEALHGTPLYREFAQLDAGITRLSDETHP